MTKAALKLAADRAFIDYALMVHLSARIDGENEHWEAIFRTVMNKHFAALVDLGLTRKEASDNIKKIVKWLNEREFSIQFFYTKGNVPSFELTFVDELDSNPEYKLMKSVMKQAGRNG